MRQWCPTCGGLMNLGKVSVCLNENTVTYRGRTIPLTMYEAELLYALARHAPHTVRHEHLRTALWGGQDGPADEGRTLSVFIGRLRRKLGTFGLTIELSKKVGYFLTAGVYSPNVRSKARWTKETIAQFLDMCRRGMPRERVMKQLDMHNIRQLRGLHYFLLRRNQQPYPFPPKSFDLRRAGFKPRCQMEEAAP